MKSKIDRRCRERVVATLPVRVRGVTANPEVSAQTRDVSANGIFLYTNSRMAEGGSGIGPDSPAGTDRRGKMLGLLSRPRAARGAGTGHRLWGRGRNPANGRLA
jgi:hypothetical protein